MANYSEKSRKMLKLDSNSKGVEAGNVKLPRFETREAAFLFTQGEKLRCPICGCDFKNLGLHLNQAHAITAREFKLATGIPLKFSLVCNSVKEGARRLTTERHAAGAIKPIVGGDTGCRNPAPKPMYWFKMQAEKAVRGRQAFAVTRKAARMEKVERCAVLLQRGLSKNKVSKMMKTGWDVVLEAERKLKNGAA